MTDDLRTGLARAVMLTRGCGVMKSGEHVFCEYCDCPHVANAAIAHLTAHLESEAMVERVAGMVGGNKAVARAVIAAQVASIGETHD